LNTKRAAALSTAWSRRWR